MRKRPARKQSERLLTEVDGAKDASRTPPPLQPKGIDRRAFLKSTSGAGVAFLAMDQVFDVSKAEAAQTTDGRIETVSGQSPYTLPRDHKWHGGGIYDTGNLEEWHYWTGFFTDDETGEELALFYCLFREGVKPGELQHLVMFSLGNLKTKDFVWAGKMLHGPLAATAPEGSTSPDDFQYRYSAPNDDTSFTTIYRAATETWAVRCKTVASARPCRCRGFELVTRKPFGYMPMTPRGLRDGNRPWTGQSDSTP